ncbi:hypothetical protein [Roseovarius indicus]|uniref:Flagellar FliJ protein n=1 Tax=Roseovarius indicus TaxID=540747 RepID=A0A0T5PC25_9RHOB|nr:hypothetical protein [Roseovarius indicus]KRS18568.1 hypothetical protein XM52_07175 [Roseovarius indicus]QEW25579.1 hypothetical protein RIdsm_01366 [Roseovarius indicus]SFE02617.1 hypothetical protein SAMN04488031_104180 [Roseovarius indicus]
MSSDRRQRALAILQRLKDRKVEELGQRIAETRAQETQAQASLEDLTARSQEAVAAATPETYPFLSDYLTAVARQKALLQVRLDQLAEDSKQLARELRASFVDAKTNDTLLEKSAEDIQRRNDLTEEAQMSEAAISAYIRRHRPF